MLLVLNWLFKLLRERERNYRCQRLLPSDSREPLAERRDCSEEAASCRPELRESARPMRH